MKKLGIGLLLTLCIVLGLLPVMHARGDVAEQFTLTPGETYWFDLSEVNLPGTVNNGEGEGVASLPDTSLHWVPFTYVGTIDAYRLQAPGAITEVFAEGFHFPHSMFIADYNVTRNVSWDDLNEKGLLFGADYKSQGILYLMRTPSVGSSSVGWEMSNDKHGVPQNNEWDVILDKAQQGYSDNTGGYIKNWKKIYSRGQETSTESETKFSLRGYTSSRYYNVSGTSYARSAALGYRPVLEILDDGTLEADVLSEVELDLNGGRIGSVEGTVKIVVKTGDSYHAPAIDGITRPEDSWGVYFRWEDGDGRLYQPGASVPEGVTKLTAKWEVEEQFDSLVPGETYWFDLSGENIPGTANSSLPDDSLTWVPFTYTGTINAYVLKESSAGVCESAAAASKTVDSNGQYGYTYDHSLLIADYVVTCMVNWQELNQENLIFGRSYTSNGVSYTLRAPSAGTRLDSIETGGTRNSEWDAILDKAKQDDYDNTDGPIKNWSGMWSCGQDTSRATSGLRATRGGYVSVRGSNTGIGVKGKLEDHGLRPVLELPATLTSDSLKIVTLQLGAGSVGGESSIRLIMKNGASFKAPDLKGMTIPENHHFAGWSDGANTYASGATVSDSVTLLTAQWEPDQYTVTFRSDGGSAVEPVTQDYGTVVAAPAAPTRTGYLFLGWYHDGTEYTFTEILTEDLTLTAQWELCDHSGNTNATDCTAETVCSACQGTVSAQGHAEIAGWKYDGHTHWAACRNCSERLREAAHSGEDDGDCTTAVLCECGQTVTAARTSHAWGSWEADGNGTHTRWCTVDGCAESDTRTCSGGTASCLYPATCRTCREKYGDRNQERHAGTAEWIRTVTTHEQKWSCCGVIAVLTEAHELKDGICAKCGYACDHTGGTATCTEKAVCTVCGSRYGSLKEDAHTGTVEWVQTAATHEQRWNCCGAAVIAETAHAWAGGVCSECSYRCVHTGGTATCTDRAVCEICREPYGERNPANHTGTEEWHRTAATHRKSRSCCEEIMIDTENHHWENGVCLTCDYRCVHTGGTADCHTRAVCTNCGSSYGEYLASHHSGKTELKGQIMASCTESGYTGDTYCSGCGAMLSSGKVAEAEGHQGGTADCSKKAECEICHEEYGERNADYHAELNRVEAVFATVQKEGNIEYWHCTACGKLYADAEGRKEISLADTVLPKRTEEKPQYRFTEEETSWESKEENLSLTLNQEVSEEVKDVFVDGKAISDDHYILRKGSSTVELKGSYLATLPDGEHTMTVRFVDGEAETTFTVAPETAASGDASAGDSEDAAGDASGATAVNASENASTGMGWLPVTAVVVLGAGAAVTVPVLRKRKTKAHKRS